MGYIFAVEMMGKFSNFREITFFLQSAEIWDYESLPKTLPPNASNAVISSTKFQIFACNL